ncbi:hypothetical protein TTHERM_00085490 (macronuclear) [Tetrahymena thermophila SB210]|uniref:Uncharacterized protein n=1 Tax=Tetrahymena thermophila (strain SB210) TaxID=312017 RepID=Q236P9_TETTS|nr:hypothetical protein TTHERM_00085490 [Tetrahymena thermophila SB210]EAR92451.1 hypothetical protein TTHERM_00085490 [Tetrahymena thermophila SB210]|eukprot:XP_001012696.1 hypothetical protein TTHERM_00085490 [Tetrahymena thermophila SB210]
MAEVDQNSFEQLKIEFNKARENVSRIFEQQQAKNKQKFEDFDNIEKDQTEEGKQKRRKIYLSLNSFMRDSKENSAKLEKFLKIYDNYIEALEGELNKIKQEQAGDQNKQADQPIKKDPSQDKFDNHDQQQRQDQQNRGSPQVSHNQQGLEANVGNNQDEKDLIIQQLKMELDMKDRDLILASDLKQQNQELLSNFVYLERANQELKQQLSQKMDYQRGNQEDVLRLREEMERLKRENQMFIEQYEALKQKSEQQEGMLEYIVAENSRLIIQSFAVSDRKYKI